MTISMLMLLGIRHGTHRESKPIGPPGGERPRQRQRKFTAVHGQRIVPQESAIHQVLIRPIEVMRVPVVLETEDRVEPTRAEPEITRKFVDHQIILLEMIIPMIIEIDLRGVECEGVNVLTEMSHK